MGSVNEPTCSFRLANADSSAYPLLVMRSPLFPNLTVLIAGVLLTASPLPGVTSTKSETKTPQTVAGNTEQQIRVQLEFIEVSHELFTSLMFGASSPVKDGELRKQLAQLIKEGKASVLETMVCSTRSGTKGNVDSNEELIYPTEYEPAQLAVEQTENATTGDGGTVPTKVHVRDLTTGPTPTAFETRLVGASMEVTPTLSADGKRIDFTLNSEIVSHVGQQIWSEWKGETGNTPIQMPTFYKIGINTTVTAADGQFLMIGAMSPKGEKGHIDTTRKLIVFLKGDVIQGAN